MSLYALGKKRPRIHPSAWVHPDAVLIGNVWVDEQASIWPGVTIRADNSPIRIGARTSVQEGSMLHTQPHNPTIVGEDCVIGHMVHLEGCIIENLVLVGSQSVVLEEVVCRTGSMVGAGALVKAGTEIPSGALAVGVPARIVPDAVNPERIRLNAQAYIEHVEEHINSMQEVDILDCITTDVFDDS